MDFEKSVGTLSYLFNQLNDKFYICGDFNAHHIMWQDRCVNNSTGINLVETMHDLVNLSLITPYNFPTYYNMTNNTYSTIDLTLCSSNLISKSQVQLGEDLRSDHCIVHIIIAIKPVLSAGKRRRRTIYDKDMWGTYIAEFH